MMHYSCHSWRRRLAKTEAAPPALTPQRQWLLGATLTLALVGVAGRAAYWQLAQHTQLAQMANQQHQHVLTIPSGRGIILDRNGVILALTVSADTVITDPQVIQQADARRPGTLAAVATRLATLTNLPLAAAQAQLQAATTYHVLTGPDGAVLHLTPDASDALRADIDAGRLPGVALEPQSWRVEPGGSLASQVLGFVSISTGQGQYGVEQAADGELSGAPGQIYSAVDADGNPVFTATQRVVPATSGADLSLTLDANLQALAEQGLRDQVARMGASGGTVIIADPQTGAILAMANAPDYDPNTYAAAPLANFVNPAISAQYDPGSTMKAITMATGIDTGTISPDTTFTDPGYFSVGGQTIYNWKHLAWGNESMTLVLQHSSNVGAAWVATHVGADRFYQYLRAFGFGSLTGVDLAGEAPGMFAAPAANQDIADLNLAENAFGESIGVTPLQLVMAYSALANGGKLMQPQIISAITRDGHTQTVAPVVARQVISPQTAAQVTQMLVASSQHSDAQLWLIPDYAIAAKTGTSTPDPANPSITYASVIGYAPADHPRFVVLVKLDHPQTSVFGGEAAGPLFRALMRHLMAYANIPPQGGH